MRTNNENRRGNYNSDASRDGKSFDKKGFNSDFKPRTNPNRDRFDDRKPYRDVSERNDNRRPFDEKRSFDRKPGGGNNYGSSYDNDRPKRPRFNNPNQSSSERLSFRKPNEAREQPSRESKFVETRFDSGNRDNTTFRKRKRIGDYDPNAKYSKKKQFEHSKQQTLDPTKPIRLNRFLANAGVASRREADEYIQAGVISVNGEIVTELGTKVLPVDKVMFHNQPVRIEQKIYLLLNKPKDYVTTVEDAHARKTVMDLVKHACSERIYPVGRLDRNTTGLLLLTNDGDLATKLTHPKYNKKKIYHITLDRDIQREDFEAILDGIDLGDLKIKADALEFVKDDSLRELGVEIHTGQNRIVRRIFDTLGYKVLKLDRVYFAGLTKKNLPRGKYRFLNDREINMLKMGAHE